MPILASAAVRSINLVSLISCAGTIGVGNRRTFRNTTGDAAVPFAIKHSGSNARDGRQSFKLSLETDNLRPAGFSRHRYQTTAIGLRTCSIRPEYSPVS